MADTDYDDYGAVMPDGEYRHGQGQAILNISGALISLGLVLGLGYWGYGIAMRDVTGIPVLRAISEPMRISPVDPGGESTAHQGLTVNAVAAVGAVADMPDQFTLAPEPVALIEEDSAGMGGMVSDAASILTDGEFSAPEMVETASNPVDPFDPVEIAMPGALDDGAVVLDQTQAEAVAIALAVALGENVGGVALEGSAFVASPRPKARPQSEANIASSSMSDTGSDTEALQSVSTESVVDTGLAEIAAADIPVGTRLVQLGAFDDRDAAKREWLRLSGQFGDLMTGKSPVVQEAQSGGRAFFRLRAQGFEDEDQARRFCAAILAEGASCIPVAQR
jgi:hypothetical protein